MTDTDSTKNLIGDDQSVADTELQVTLPELPGGLAPISPPIGIDTSRVIDQALDLDMKYKMSSWSGVSWQLLVGSEGWTDTAARLDRHRSAGQGMVYDGRQSQVHEG